MMSKINRTRLFLSLAFSTTCATFALEHASAQATDAPTASPPAQKQESLNWVREAGKAYVLQAVQPPPAAGSDTERADIQAVLKAQAARTASDVAEANADRKFTIELLTQDIGPNFTAENYPVTFDFLKRVQAEADILNSMLQAKYQRHRPYQDHPEVKNLYTAEQSSYPGAEASASRMVTLILTQFFFDKTTALLHRDEVIAQGTVNAGVNYPSDVIGGRALAHALLFVLQGNPIFMSDLAKAQAEVRRKADPGTGK